MPEQKLLDLAVYSTSDAFDDRERLVLDLAVEMAETPTDLSGDLRQRLEAAFDETERVELVSAIAWEHYRARFNRVFDVGSAGFSEGAFCVLPERPRPVRQATSSS